MQPKIYSEFISFAGKLADASGDILRQYFLRGIEVEQKADASPVTKADREVEQGLRQMVAEAFPEHGIVGEEFGSVQPYAKYKWVIDPIDGTKSFIAGYPIFTTLIALLENDIPVLGVIDQPILRHRWAAAIGGEALFNGALLAKLDNKKNLAGASIATTSTAYFTQPQAKKTSKISTSCNNTILGGDAYAYAMLASGRIDAVLDAGMKPYDYCALAPIVKAAGGIITDWGGNEVTLHSSGEVLAAASAALHSEILQMLK